MTRGAIKECSATGYPVHFKPEELVMLHTLAVPIKEDEHTVKSHTTKLLLRWTGPHKVVNQIPNNPNVYKIQMLGVAKPQVINIARLLKYTPFEATKAPRVLTKAMQLQKEQAQRSAAARSEYSSCKYCCKYRGGIGNIASHFR